MKKYLMIMIAAFTMHYTNAQEATKKKTETVVIQTSAQCGDCEERIESALNYLKGVVFAELDNETKKVTVKYKTSALTVAQIKQKIAETGYAADEVKATEEGIDKLPACCKPGGMDKK
jgi:periplasmic mercuric ion binding protein